VRFENLEVWKKAAQLSGEIYKELRELKDYGPRIKSLGRGSP